MGVLNGSVSYALYHVEGELPEGFRERFLEKIEEFRFLPLTPEAEEEESVGWVVVGDLLSTEFTRESVFPGHETVCLSMRVDRWSLPAALLKATLAQRVAARCEETGRTRLSRLETEQVREVVRREFKQQMLPSASLVDMVWSLSSRTVRFWSHSARARELFESLFEATFFDDVPGAQLVLTGPYIAARALPLTGDQLACLSEVESDGFGEQEP